MDISIGKAKPLIIEAFKAKLLPMLHSSPGLGKSSLIKEIAEELNLELIDIRLSQMDPVDLMGLPSKTDNGKYEFLPSSLFPIEGDKLPPNKDGWLILLDEINSAPLSIQAASYRIALDREIGNHKLHSHVAIAAAGNKSTDKAVVNRMSTALQSRMIHLSIEPDLPSWIEWANKNGIDYRITSFLEFRPDLLHKFDPNHNDLTFPCSRTWEFASRLLKNKELTKSNLPLIAGTIGEGAAMELRAFLDLYSKLPKFSQLISGTHRIKEDEEPSIYYALTGMLAENLSNENIAEGIKVVNQLPPEFQLMCMRTAISKKRVTMQPKAVQDWAKDKGKQLFRGLT